MKLPAAMSQPESVFENPQLPQLPNPNPNPQSPIPNPQLPALGSSTVTVDVAVVNIPEGAESVQAYQLLQTSEEDRTWMQRFSSVGVTRSEKPKPTSDEHARAREAIEQLKARKAQERKRTS